MRVIAGRLRGRRLHALSDAATRPTTDRVRRALFDWLGSRVEGADILDLFAGSGALGIEALSRGAARATFVEGSAAARAVLRRNLRELGLEAESDAPPGGVARALSALARGECRFDLVFADPPYGSRWGERLLRSRELPLLIAPAGELLLERSARDAPGRSEGPLRLAGARAWGGTRFDRYQRREGCAP